MIIEGSRFNSGDENKLKSFRTTFLQVLIRLVRGNRMEFHSTITRILHRATNVSKCQWLTAETIIVSRLLRGNRTDNCRIMERCKIERCLKVFKPFSCAANSEGGDDFSFLRRERFLEGRIVYLCFGERGCPRNRRDKATIRGKEGGRDKRILTERRHLLYPLTFLPLRHPVILHSR